MIPHAQPNRRRSLSHDDPNTSQATSAVPSFKTDHLPPLSGQTSRHLREGPRKKVALRRLESDVIAPSPQRHTLHRRTESSAPSRRAFSKVPSETRSLLQNEDAISEYEQSDALNEVIMALDIRNKETVGCCYYVAKEEKLYFTADIKFGGLDAVDNSWFSIQPHISSTLS